MVPNSWGLLQKQEQCKMNSAKWPNLQEKESPKLHLYNKNVFLLYLFEPGSSARRSLLLETWLVSLKGLERDGVGNCHRNRWLTEISLATCSIFIMSNNLTEEEFRLITLSPEK